MFAVVIIMTDKDKLIMDVSGAWVREVSPMLATSRVFLPEHLGTLSYKHDVKALGDSQKKQTGVSPTLRG